jgi:hypothetical protein
VAGNAGQTCQEEPCGPKIAPGLRVALIAAGLVYGVSVHGFRKARQCREVLDSQLSCRDGNIAACQKLQPDASLPEPAIPMDRAETRR